MKADWIMKIVMSFVTMSGFRMLLVPAAEVRLVHFGSNITLGCNVSYLYGTTWLKQNPNLRPTVVLCASLKDGRAHESFQLSPRHSVGLVNRSLALRITGVEAEDLGLYYCIGSVNSGLIIGKATHIYSSAQALFQHGYPAAVCSVLLILILTVCTTSWKTRQKKKKIPDRNSNE